MSRKAKQKEKKKNKILVSLQNIGIGKERDYFVENLAMLAASGMTILSALSGIKKEMRTKRMRKAITDIEEDIISGSPLWRALDSAGLFPAHAVSLIRIGEESGKLSDNLKVVAGQSEKERIFKSKIRSAMMYPLFVLTLTLVVGIGIAWFILPRLAGVFAQLRLDLPLVTKTLIGAGEFLGEHGAIVIPIFLLTLAILIYIIFYFPKTKFIGQSILFHTPGVKRLIKEVEISRFGYLLGTLLEAGLPVVAAIDSLEKATVFPHYRKFYAHLGGSIADGNSFQKSFASYKKSNVLVPATVLQMVSAGEQSGNLSGTLLKIGETFETKTETTTKNLTVILEPILLVIVWLGVVSVALAVILPIYNLIGGLNNPGGTTQNTEKAQPVATPAKTTQIDLEIATTTPAQPDEKIEAEIPSLILKVLETGIGYLNVRSIPSTQGEIIDKVYPSETYEYTDEQNGWYEIILLDEETGWVFGKYVEIVD